MDGYVFLAYDYPVLGAFWTVMWIFLWVVWLMLLFRVIADVFRDHDLSGWAKAGWLLFVIVVPFLGVLVYVITRGKEMGKRETLHAQARQEELEEYLRRTVAGTSGMSAADELAKLSELKARGEISEAEFQQTKEKILR
ncbi:SHOCT domain-containing protein [Streptomyces sp. 8N616]|uniref:SHOCT domain-containing protein n=1 Tax=Streptomyces sp. 8N616 TaxID=3457414 RepID=UPI003FD63F24